MALNDDWVQQLLKYEVTLEPPEEFSGSSYGNISRAWIDGTLIVFDPDDVPSWLSEVLLHRDEDGNTELAEPRSAAP